MTPDEVVKELQKRLNTQEILNKPDKDLVLLYKSTLSLIQDYQKLRERVSVEKIRDVIYETAKDWNFSEGDFSFLDIAQAIVTYLQQPTEQKGK